MCEFIGATGAAAKRFPMLQRSSQHMSARPLTEAEYLTLLAYFRAQKMTRNAALLVVGCGTGYRITELLSLTVSQLWTGTEVAKEITISRRMMKGGAGAYKRAVRSRRMPLSEPVRAAILEHLQTIGTDQPESAFFRTGQTITRGMDRPQAHRVLVSGCEACGIPSNRISTHTLRKTFAARIYAQTKCLITLQRLLGHRSPVTTARYLESDAAELDRLVLGLAA